jgi:hypothetical protein
MRRSEEFDRWKITSVYADSYIRQRADIQQQSYAVVCSQCKWSQTAETPDQAIEDAKDYGWRIKNGVPVCDSCLAGKEHGMYETE